MAINCTSPSSLFVWTDVNGDRQTKLLPYGTDHYTTPDGSILSSPYLVPCGRCLPCKKSKAAEWSNRLVCESKYHEKSCFLTLTYTQDDVPRTYDSKGKMHFSLRKKDLQDFIKRLRRYLEYNKMPDIRYYAVGEYGSKTYRPHYHAIIFGYFPDDSEIVKYNSKGQHLYHSAVLSKIWKHGEVMIGACSAQTMFYTASYVTGKQLGFNSYAWYDAMSIERPFAVMSRRPGIGYQYCIDHKDKILNSEVLSVGIDGELSTFTAPRYFLEQFRLTQPEIYAKLKSDRLKSLSVSTKDKRFVGRDYIEKRERSDFEDNLAADRYSKKRIGI